MVKPTTMEGLAGVTAMELKVAAVTVSVVFADVLPMVAVITDEPAATPVARPLALIVATRVSPDDQVTNAVMSSEVPSE